VVVDLYGEIHALARQIEGVKTKEVKARLAGVALDELPDARRAQDFAREQLEKQRAAAPQTSQDTAATMRADLEKEQRQRRGDLDKKRKDLFAQHRTEREALAAAQESEVKGVLSARLRAQPRGVIAFIARITGIRLLAARRQKKQDQARAREHTAQREALKRRHARETLEFQHRYRGLISLEKRERRSLETALRRAQFRMIAEPRKLPARATQSGGAQAASGISRLTPEQRARLEAMRRAGMDMTRPAARRTRSPDSRVSDPFNSAAAKRSPQPAQERAGKQPDAQALEEMRRAGQDITAPPPSSSDTGDTGGLSGTFNNAARKDRLRKAAKELREEQRRKRRSAPGSDRDRER
jgi:hypothetical protein